MNNLKKLILIFAGFALLVPSVAFAVVFTPTPNLVVDFEASPLFSQTNIAPGDSVTRYIKVTNTSTNIKNVIVESINESDPDNLASQLKLKITEGSTTIFDKTLKFFFDQGETLLSSLAGGGTQTQYDFTVTFDSASANDYQDKNLGFDFLIGLQGSGGSTSSGGGSGGSSGGGGTGGGTAFLPGLSILEDSIVVTDVGQTTATVVWNTNYFSTSQVIFAEQGIPFTFDLNALKFGYPNASAEIDNSITPNGPKVTHHSVTITGLTAGTTYVLRAVSHASPPSISTQKSFTTLALSQQDANDSFLAPTGGQVAGDSTTTPATFGAGGGNKVTGSGTSASTQGEVLGTEDTKTPDSQISEESKNDGASKNDGNSPWWEWWWNWLIILVIILIILYIIFKRRKDKENQANRVS